MWLSKSELSCNIFVAPKQVIIPNTKNFQRESEKDLSHKQKFEK